MSKTILNLRSLEIKLKAGATSAELEEYFGYSHDLLLNEIRQRFSDKAVKHYEHLISRNDKRAKKRKKGSLRNAEEVILVKESIPMVSNVLVEENRDKDLDALQAKLSGLKKSLCDKELEHREVERFRHSIRKQLYKHKEFLLNLKTEITTAEEAIVKLQEEISSTNLQMIEINEEIHSIQSEMEEVECQIAKLQKIPVYVYNNGTVDVSLELPANWEKVFSSLILNEDMGNFSLNQIRSLAKVLTLQREYKEKQFEFLFETKELENQFNKNKEEDFIDN